MPENRGSQDNRERNPHKENEPHQDYYQASRYNEQQVALDTYEQLQDLLLNSPDVDLSTYRFLVNQVSFVAVLGKQPPDEIETEVIGFLSAGERIELPDTILKALRDRRAQATKQGPWIEGHYRPGKHMR